VEALEALSAAMEALEALSAGGALRGGAGGAGGVEALDLRGGAGGAGGVEALEAPCKSRLDAALASANSCTQPLMFWKACLSLGPPLQFYK
jgi:hypothetical protein